MVGGMTDIGIPLASVNWLYRNSSVGAQAMTAPVVTSAASPMLASSQRPERVSNDVRSSTATMRVRGMRRPALTALTVVSVVSFVRAVAAGATAAVLVVLRLLLAGDDGSGRARALHVACRP